MGLAGLAAAGYLMVAALMSGYRTASTARASRSHASDYDGWLFGFVALSVTLLSSMLASVLLFMLFLGIGVLIAPALAKAESPPWNRAGFIAVSFVSIAVGVALAAFALLGAAAQLTAVGVRSGDADTGYGRATRAVALAPWDTQLRELKNEMMVQAALDHVFTGKSDAAATLASAEKSLEQAAAREPYEYLHPYRSAILLIGAGQKLGVEYTKRGIDAGLRGLRIYPNSLELRTGVASGYLQLSQPEKAEALLKDFWEADPNYSAIGVAYVRALIAQGKLDEAQSALTIMEIRFPQEQAIADLQSQVSPK
jgi:predicted Zn-dependent protease